MAGYPRPQQPPSGVLLSCNPELNPQNSLFAQMCRAAATGDATFDARIREALRPLTMVPEDIAALAGVNASRFDAEAELQQIRAMEEAEQQITAAFLEFNPGIRAVAHGFMDVCTDLECPCNADEVAAYDASREMATADASEVPQAEPEEQIVDREVNYAAYLMILSANLWHNYSVSIVSKSPDQSGVTERTNIMFNEILDEAPTPACVQRIVDLLEAEKFLLPNTILYSQPVDDQLFMCLDPVMPPLFAAGDVCSVCLETLDNAQKILRYLPCSHAFHAACLNKWWRGQAECTCPNCRCQCLRPV